MRGQRSEVDNPIDILATSMQKIVQHVTAQSQNLRSTASVALRAIDNDGFRGVDTQLYPAKSVFL